MESPVRTSFIPKQAVQTVASHRQRPAVSIFLIIGVLIFFFAIVASGGIYFYKGYLTQKLDNQAKTLQQEKDAFKPDFLEELSQLDTRLNVANALLAAHQAPSLLFKFLEENTIVSVRFLNFDYTKNTATDAEPGSMVLAMKGQAQGFGSVALQSDRFGSSKVIKNPIFSGLDLSDVGQVTFSVKAVVDPKELLYSKMIIPAEDMTPEVTGEQPLENEAAADEGAIEDGSTLPGTLEKQAYSNTQHGFKINSPKGWREDKSGRFGTLVFFSNSQTDQEGVNPFGANINVISESTHGLNLDGYVNASKDALPKLLQNYKPTVEKKVSANGVPARIIGGTFVQGVFHLRNLQLIVVKGEQAYIVTGTVLESTWNKYASLIEASLLTFELS